jgi:prophage regulatory protein
MLETRTPPRRIAKSREVQDRTGYSRVQIWRKARNANDDFPVPVRLGGNRIGWHEEEIQNWIAKRPRVTWAADKTSRLASPDTTDDGEAGS